MEKGKEIKPILPKVLGEYALSNSARFQSPGHKGTGLGGFFREELSGWDIIRESVVDGKDDLLAASEETFNRYYHAAHTYFITGGVSSAIRCIFRSLSVRESVLLPSHCNRHALYAAAEKGLNLYFMNESEEGHYESADKMESDLVRTGATAVFISSPDVLGYCSDLKTISEVAHRHNALLLVDASYGAHFPFSDRFPDDAGQYADMWCCGQYYSMNALVQGGTLHLNHCRICPETVSEAIEIMEAENPSTLIDASIDWALHIARNADYELLYRHCKALADKIDSIEGLSVEGKNDPGKDFSRIAINVSGSGYSGYDIYGLLRGHGIYPSYCDKTYVVLSCNLEDKPEWYIRTEEVLSGIQKQKISIFDNVYRFAPPNDRDIRAAFLAERTWIPFGETKGMVLGCPVGLRPSQNIMLYPGTVLDSSAISWIRDCLNEGAPLFGVSGDYCIGVVYDN